MTYLNPILSYGVEAFAVMQMRQVFAELIVPDMPLEESGIIHEALVHKAFPLYSLYH